MLELITDASPTFHGLWNCTRLVQWSHSLYTDSSAVFCTHTKVTSYSLLYSRPEWTFPLSRRHCRISIAETQTCLQALSLLSGYNTLHSAYISSDYTKTCFESRIPQILLTSERGHRSNKAFVANILQMCCRKKWNSNISPQRKSFQRKKAKKSQKTKRIF